MNLHRLLWNAKKTFNIDNRTKTDLNPVYVIKETKKLETNLKIVEGQDQISLNAQKNSTILFRIHLRTFLNSKKLVINERLSKESFD